MMELKINETKNINGGTCTCYERKNCAGTYDEIENNNIENIKIFFTVQAKCKHYCCEIKQKYYKSYQHQFNSTITCETCNNDYKTIDLPPMPKK